MIGPLIDEERCMGCSACVALCPNDVLTFENEKAKINHIENCDRTGDCAKICPTGAITLPWLSTED